MEGSDTWLQLENSIFTEFNYTAYLLAGLTISLGKREFCMLSLSSVQTV